VIRGSTNIVDGRATATDTSNTQVIAAQGAGIKIHVTTLVISNSSSSNTEVHIKSGTTTKLTVPAPATGGAVMGQIEPPLVLNANEALNFAAAAGVTTMTVSAIGYKGE